MEKTVFFEAQLQARRLYTLLNEVLDISQQMLEAADRGDEVTIHLLLGERGELIHRLSKMKNMLDLQYESDNTIESKRIKSLLNGDSPQNEEEQPLAAQVIANQNLLQTVLEIDQRLNRKVAQEDSVYNSDLHTSL